MGFAFFVILFFAASYAALRLTAVVSYSMLRQKSSVKQTWQRGEPLVLPIFLVSFLLVLFAFACSVLAFFVLTMTGVIEDFGSATFAVPPGSETTDAGSGIISSLILYLFCFPAQLMWLSIPAYAAMAMADEPGE